MRTACLGMGQLLERRASGLSAPEGLRLEEHLASCVHCSADANLLRGLSRLALGDQVALSDEARQRAITGALTSTASARAPQTTRPPRRALLLLSAAAALAAGGLLMQRAAAPETPLPPTAAHEAAPMSDRVLSGQVDLLGSDRGAGTPLSERAQVYTRSGAVLALAHAQVELRADSEASWDQAARKLSLQRGSAMIEVDPARHQSFGVETRFFGVAVLGTRFEVTPRAVHVLRGSVLVQPSSPDAAPIVLAAGSGRADFELPPVAAEMNNAHDASPEPTQRPAPSRSKRAVNASELLQQARAQLAARELSQARATLKLAAAHLTDAAVRAQALSLEAECELLEHHFEAARDSYLRVLRQFPSLPAAETALFAAARIEAEHGEPTRARELLMRYLAKYPTGSFVSDVERRMHSLPERSRPEPAQ